MTHFMDLSNIYGSTDSVEISVRTMTDGQLSVGSSGVMAEHTGDCTGYYCFFTGNLNTHHIYQTYYIFQHPRRLSWIIVPNPQPIVFAVYPIS